MCWIDSLEAKYRQAVLQAVTMILILHQILPHMGLELTKSLM